MSASEKLRALDAAMTLEASGSWKTMQLANKRLVDALPLIADVVEAAEKHVDEEWAAFAEFGEPEHGDVPPNTSVTNAKLVAALTALQEALNGSAGDGGVT